MIDQVRNILNKLRQVDSVQATVVLDRDGLLIATATNTQKGSAEELASLFARAIHLFERKIRPNEDEEGENIQQMIIERQGDEKLILSVATQFILALVTRGNINLGLIQLEIQDAIVSLKPLLES